MLTYSIIGALLYIPLLFTILALCLDSRWFKDHTSYYKAKRDRKREQENMQNYHRNHEHYVRRYNDAVAVEKKSLKELIAFCIFIVTWPLIWAPAIIVFVGYWLYRAVKATYESLSVKPVEVPDPNIDRHSSFKE